MDMSPTSNVIKLETPSHVVPRIGMTSASVADGWGFMPGPLVEALIYILEHEATDTPITHLRIATARIKAARHIDEPLHCVRCNSAPRDTLAVARAWRLGDYLYSALNEMRAGVAAPDGSPARIAHLDAAEVRVWDEIILRESGGKG